MTRPYVTCLCLVGIRPLLTGFNIDIFAVRLLTSTDVAYFLHECVYFRICFEKNEECRYSDRASLIDCLILLWYNIFSSLEHRLWNVLQHLNQWIKILYVITILALNYVSIMFLFSTGSYGLIYHTFKYDNKTSKNSNNKSRPGRPWSLTSFGTIIVFTVQWLEYL